VIEVVMPTTIQTIRIRSSGDDKNGSNGGSVVDCAMRRGHTMRLWRRGGGRGPRRRSRLLRRRLRRTASGIVMGTGGSAGMRMGKGARPRMCEIGDLGLEKRSARDRAMRMLRRDAAGVDNENEIAKGTLRRRRRPMRRGGRSIRAASRRTVLRIC
jgi:hypothetical protein